ncbi:ApbE family protein [Nitrincola sp. A-D6]|uniref:(Na+)-NQR maturation NqrM n=1 Tax=Nitrincola sp. A-D6 TaxID=1545442 RepID=UPI00051FC260|nr:(Na+)-NQR maturation NqrM [Nitrincola sp. A-D6]KGK43366.1 ApbE family protein [Nitrincola sp. A-D6]
MEVFFITLVILLLLTLGMSVGVIMGRKPIAGSCGGMSSLGMETACDICGGDKEICDDEDEKQRIINAKKQGNADLAYEVNSKG